MTFDEALKHTLEFEGGYVDDPQDRGGETFRGVSRKNWPQWGGWKLIDQAKAQGHKTRKAIDAYFAHHAEMEALVAAFYRDNFWKPLDTLALPPRAQAKVFDTSVNVGVGQAMKFLQRALNTMGAHLEADGKRGAKTIAAVKEFITGAEAESRLLTALVKQQEDFYRAIVAKNPSQSKFLAGWLRRAQWVPR